MTPYRESELRKLADPPTLRIIDKWQSICNRVLGRPIEIVADSRRNSPKYGSFKDEVNTAEPDEYNGKAVLRVWLESFPRLELLLVSHEIGHWVLKLQGFRGMLCSPRRPLIEGCLNSLATHRPLHDLQRSFGHEPRDEVDSRADHDIKLCLRPGPIDDASSALYLADDFLNCSYKKRGQMKQALRKKHPNTMRYVERIVRIASQHDLLNPEQSIAFRRRLIKELKLGGVWSEQDDVSQIKDLILKVEGIAS